METPTIIHAENALYLIDLNPQTNNDYNQKVIILK